MKLLLTTPFWAKINLFFFYYVLFYYPESSDNSRQDLIRNKKNKKSLAIYATIKRYDKSKPFLPKDQDKVF